MDQFHDRLHRKHRRRHSDGRWRQRSALGFHGYIGYNNGVSGLVTVSGTGSTWKNSHSLFVGYNGTGTVSVTTGGSVSNGGDVYVGYGGSGEMNVTNGGTISNILDGYIGYFLGSTGTMTVDGAASAWTNRDDSDLYIGYRGSGTLNVTNGGSVTVTGGTYAGLNTGATGAVDFGSNGGTLTTLSLFAAPSQLTGAGTIKTRGLVSDINLVFDATHGLQQSPPGFGSVTVNLDMRNGGNYLGAAGMAWDL